MGASLNNNKVGSSEVFEAGACKRQRVSSNFWDDNARLIPSLPDEISIQVLARVPRIWYVSAKRVSRHWRDTLTSGELYKVRKELYTTEEWLYVLTKIDGEKLVWHALDPASSMWQRLPIMPHVASEDRKQMELSGLPLWSIVSSFVIWIGRKYTLEVPCCGCAIGAVDGCLYVIGGFFKASAVNTVWRYDPTINSWTEAPPMVVGRAYCKTSVLDNKLYVVGGVTHGDGGLTALQSAEVFDPRTGIWSEVPSMPFLKAHMHPSLLKPIATGMVSYRGKLYVPQSLYRFPFVVDVGGEVYDPETSSWVEMPAGMGGGWPANQALTKLGVIVDDELYAFDPSNYRRTARIKVYDNRDDAWKTIEGYLPIGDLTDSRSPYLLAGFLGKLHVITKDTKHNISVMQYDCQNEHIVSIPSTSSVGPGKPLQELSGNASVSSSNVWKVIATKIAGAAELVSCQILDI